MDETYEPIERIKDVLSYHGKAEPMTIQQTHNMTGFLRANYDKMKMWTVTNGKETFVVLKWPHVVPELKVLP